MLLRLLEQVSTWFNGSLHLSVFWFLELWTKKHHSSAAAVSSDEISGQFWWCLRYPWPFGSWPAAFQRVPIRQISHQNTALNLQSPKEIVIMIIIKKGKTQAKDSMLPRWLLNSPVSLSKLAEALPLQALMPRNMLEFMMGQDDMKSSVSEKISRANRSIAPMYQVIQTNVLHWIWCCSCCASFFTENKLVAARLLFQTEQVSCWKDCETAAMHVALCHSERCDSLKFAQHS